MRSAVMVLLVGCAGVDESPQSTSLGSNECDSVEAGGGWKNDFVPQSLGRSEYTFKAIPSGNAIDAVIGVSDGRADAFGDLGAILRFNPQGFVDARNGGSYQAVTRFAYQAGVTYDVVIAPDLHTHTYYAWIKDERTVQQTDGEDVFTRIGDGFAFRTEQASVGRLDNFARKIDSATGALRICNFYPSSYEGYLLSEAGTGWASVPFKTQTGRFRAEIDADAATVQGGWSANTDGVIGLSRVTPRFFSDLAAIVRFNPAGYLDVRDGSTYRYDTRLAYTGERLHFVFDVDVTRKRYSVSVAPWDRPTETTVLATDYAFRTEQQGVTQLGVLGQINDSADGYVSSFNLKVSY